MTSAFGPRPNVGKESIADVRRRLLRSAYPDGDPSWIDEQVALAGERIDNPESFPEPEPAPAPPPISARRRNALMVAVGAGFAAAAIVALGITQREQFAQTALDLGGVLILIVATVVALVATIVDLMRARRRKVLSCRVRIDARFDVDTIDAGEIVTLQRRGDKTAIRNAGVVVARIKNMGRTPIEPVDYLTPLMISFPGREVVTVDVTESDPPDLADRIAIDPEFVDGVAWDRILLPKIPLAPSDSFKLVIVLSGTEAGRSYTVDVGGSLHNGMVTTKPSFRRFKRTTIAGGAVTTLLAGALSVVLLLNAVPPFTQLPPGLVCVSGGLTISGSSAFGLAATKSAGSYHAYCPGSVVDVLTPGSLQGLQELHDAPPAVWPTQLALSDGMADPRQFPGLVSDALGIVPYTFVANAKAPINHLTLAQAQAIFTGKVSQWSQITRNPKDTNPIRVVERTASSGTRRALEHYVLGTPNAPVPQAPATSDSCKDVRPQSAGAAVVVCETSSSSDLVSKVASVDYSIGYADVPDVKQAEVKQAGGVQAVSLDGRGSTLSDILAGYPFWTVEYLYSHGPRKPGTLSAAFADYLGSPESSSAMASFQYYACRNTTGLCASGR
jgi:phosphate transport system substrate-binding protein